MPSTPRCDIFDPEVVGVYHCYSQCVQRAFLCGIDRITGNDYSHRKGWIRDGLKRLVGAMALDVLDYAILDNHLHVVLRNRPDIVDTWSDEEVVRRWWQVCPDRRDEHGDPAEPSHLELRMMLCDPDKVAERRKRLSDISWFMRLLCQPVARRANREMDVTGRFFAHRFDCTRIVDDAGVLACSLYVDLNLIHAGVAESPETSEYTSAYDRIRARLRRHARELGQSHGPVQPVDDEDAWLAPIFLDERAESHQRADKSASPADGAPARLGNTFPSPRVSNKGFLSLTDEFYLSLLDWLGRETRSDKRGAIPAHLAPILDRMGLRAEQLVDAVRDFGTLFTTLVGRSDAVREHAARMGRRWVHGVRNCDAVFG